jgi:hypothetical protein
MQQIDISVFNAVSKFCNKLNSIVDVNVMYIDDSRTVSIYCNSREEQIFLKIIICKNEDDDFDYSVSKYSYEVSSYVNERCLKENNAFNYAKQLVEIKAISTVK